MNGLKTWNFFLYT